MRRAAFALASVFASLTLAAACGPKTGVAPGEEGGNGEEEEEDCPDPNNQRRCGGVCVDQDTDPNHCGACGHACLGAPCIDYVCDPLTLAFGQDLQKPIFLDATHVTFTRYVTASGPEDKIFRVPKDGGDAKELATTGKVKSLVVLKNRVVWSAAVTVEGGEVERRIESCALPDCTDRKVIVPHAHGGGDQVLATDGERLFWVNGAAASDARRFSVESCDVASCEATLATFAPARSGAWPHTPGFAVSDDYVFWSVLGELHGCPKAGCTGDSRYPAPGTIGKVGTNGAEVFFMSFDGPEGGNAKVMACAVTGCGNAPRIVYRYSYGELEENDVAADDKKAFFSLGDQLDSCPVTGCDYPGPVVQNSLEEDTTIQLDETYVYVVHYGPKGRGFELVRAPK